MSRLTDEEYAAIHSGKPDPVMDKPSVSHFWRRRLAAELGMANPDAPWVDMVACIATEQRRRDEAFAGGMALRFLRIENERLRGELAAAEQRGYERARAEDIAALRDDEVIWRFAEKHPSGEDASSLLLIAAEYLESLASSLVKGDSEP